ncbi:MAG: hydrolase 2, exosortase A system-associated [Chromatiales bacterium]|nr:hydrolase 2, exosortase A system-associated [Chromatiales bacterium]
MTSPASPEPFFLDGPHGACFCLWYPVPAPRRAAVVLPPFAEEMNKSRRMLSLAARALQSHGVAVLLPDLGGTGDSAGDHSDASMARWREEVAAMSAWIGERLPGSVDVLALRTGALLCDAIANPGRVCLWQPVVDGRRYLAQFLRLALAAGLTGKRDADVSPQRLRERLAAGDTIEVAGYALSPALVTGLESARLEPAALAGAERIDQFELVAQAETPATPAAQSWAAAAGANLHTCVGVPFWQSGEIVTLPALIDATAALWP